MGARFLVAAFLGCAVGSAPADDAPGSQSLRALEQRALQAQSLVRHVEELEARLKELREQQEDMEAVAARARIGSSALESTPGRQSLRALEQRALQAQALERHVKELEARLDAHRDQLREMEAALNQMRAERDAVSEERDVLRDEVAALKQVQGRQERLLAMYRSGDFEYYQVREGDTTATIAANPMVYGDSKRAVWIDHANALSPTQSPAPGTVLIIPRFSEGITHDL